MLMQTPTQDQPLPPAARSESFPITHTEYLGGHCRAVCSSCGWAGEWRDARYLANGERGAHRCRRDGGS
jgi:hypothetical protein